ncbi:hypothetical protein ASE98_07100 [Pseudomonas sp. Leaf48]|nr:hypothetical protein ASE98_07100 [Pseudomonas sp. Leaf48]
MHQNRSFIAFDATLQGGIFFLKGQYALISEILGQKTHAGALACNLLPCEAGCLGRVFAPASQTLKGIHYQP